MKVISRETREEAWLEAVEHLSNEALGKIEYNLILEVTKPGATTGRSNSIKRSFDDFLTSNDLYSVQTVADTIFPASLYKKYGREGVYEIYPNEIYPKLRKDRANQRGTYAQRIVRGRQVNGELFNPLAYIVERLKRMVETNGARCANEISIDESDTIPINRNDKSLYAFPCLSHLSFKLSHDRSEVHLTAIYRSQFFIEKAMGNLLGLARLQDFVCREVGIKMGTLVCHATYAKLDDQGKVRGFRNLLNALSE
jgi:hypothetical protein